MTTTVSFSPGHSWSRRCSTETVFSIQGKETDYVRDTSDTSSLWSDDANAEYEPVTDLEEDGPISCDSSGGSDNEIIATKVIEVTVMDDGDLFFADSERTESNDSDSEIDHDDYWKCAQCHARNNNPRYRYCEQCFKARKNFFPPRPKPKAKRPSPERDRPKPEAAPSASVTGLEALNSLSQDSAYDSLSNCQSSQEFAPVRKRRADSVEGKSKRIRTDSTGSRSDTEQVSPLVKMVSDPLLTVAESNTKATNGDESCIVCMSKPKSGVFVHGRIAHICCCYDCAMKVWAKAKRCPVCNCKVSNVLRAVVM